MREIIFRGMTKDGKWSEGDLIHRKDKIYIYPEGGLDSYDNYEVIPETVGQFTGLLDKNGVKIFEGDEIESKSHKPNIYKIGFIDSCFCATHPDLKGWEIDISHFYPSSGCQIEVIGNVHDKKEGTDGK